MLTESDTSLVEYNSVDVEQILKRVKSAPSESIESDTVEFKNYSSESALQNDKKLAEEICALANHRGGVLVVGVVDSSDIVGMAWESQLHGFERVDEISTKNRVTGKLQSLTEIRVENIDFEGKSYTAFFVRKDISRLITTASGKTCIRDGRDSRPMTPEELQNAVKSLQSYDWSSEPEPRATIANLNEEHWGAALTEFCHRRELEKEPSIESFLESIGATKNGVLTKGAILLLGKVDAIRDFLGDFEFRVSWKRGTDLLLNEVWTDNLWSSLKKANSLFENFFRVEEIEYSGKYYEVPNLDRTALDEAFINALVHRDYSVDGMISVEFTGSELFIVSPGSFYGGVTSENIAWHKPRHRNKNLARMFMEYRLVDRAGMGIQRMGVKSLVYGRKFPEFEEIEDSIQVKMETEFLRPGIFVLTQNRSSLYITDLILLNSLYEVGNIELSRAVILIRKVVREQWSAIQQFVQRWENYVYFAGSKEAIHICVREESRGILKVTKNLSVPKNSEKFVQLFKFLKAHVSATNQDLSENLHYSHGSTASRFLNEVKWISKAGTGASAKWKLSPPYGPRE